MATTVKHLDPTRVELEFTISADALERAREHAFNHLVRSARVPGFRPGKVPRRVFERSYGTAGIEQAALDEVLPAEYQRALTENSIDPLELPTIELLPPDEADASTVRVRAEVSIRPAIALGTYKGVPLTGEAAAVTDDEVDYSLESLRRDQAALVPVERAAQLGDIVLVDFAGTVDGVAFEGGTAQQQQVELLEERFVPGFASGIAGMSAGESKTIDAHFPDDYAEKSLAGKTAQFAITLHDVKVPEVPPLDDEFAQRFGGENANLAGLRDDVRARLTNAKESRRRRALSGQLLEKLRDEHDVPLPAVMVERETESLISDTKAEAARAGIEWEQYLSASGRTEETVAAELKGEAEKRVENSLLLAAIAQAEGITASVADVEGEIASLAAQYRQPKDAVRQMLQPNLNALKEGIVRSKTLDFLVDNAKVTEGPAGPAKAES